LVHAAGSPVGVVVAAAVDGADVWVVADVAAGVDVLVVLLPHAEARAPTSTKSETTRTDKRIQDLSRTVTRRRNAS
jgi:hypothetical protein